MVLLIAFLLGMVHVISPDHWVPLSLQSWQRGWTGARTRGVASQFLLLHVLTGLFAALLLREGAGDLGDASLFILSLAIVFVTAGIRFFRFSKLREAFLAGPQSKRGILAAWSMMGPAESLIPVVLKSLQLGQGYLLPVAAYFAGTLLMGTGLVLWGRRLWNRPAVLAQGYAWVHRLNPLA